jgi:superfamily II DNA or RNA helicase
VILRLVNLERLLNSLSERADQRGREFERLCQWLLRSAPEYRGQVCRVWLWDEWPGRWAADAGIDLVAETRAGELWAVQAKAYDPSYRVKKADIDSFLSESARPEFSYRLLIATTDLIGANARRTLAGQEKPAGVLLRSQLAAAQVLWPKSFTELAPAAPARKRPRQHQREAVRAIVKGFRTSDRGQAVMACGTGKTLVGLLVAVALESERTLVLVPSLSLLAQTLREWTASAERVFAFMAVCSDETVVGEDAVVSTTSELGFPVTTEPDQIADFLQSESGRRVVFATYQSSSRIAEAFQVGLPAFDLVVADEAHRCAGPRASEFATVLDDDRIPARRRLFMTATPRIFTERLRREASEVDFEIASMDDEARFGPLFHRLTFGEAIRRDLLSDYQVVVVGVSQSTYREYAERGVFVTADGEGMSDARTLASQLGLLRAMATYDLRRVVSFHSRIGTARAFSRTIEHVFNWLPEPLRPTGRLRAAYVSGLMSSGERDRRLNELREIGLGERGLLTNCRCLAEGVDVPTLDGVAFIDPRRSQIDIVQAVGRAIRTAPDKSIGTIVIPVFVDETVDPESALEVSTFDRIWQVVKALRAHDEVLAEQLDSLRRELGRGQASPERPAKIRLDLPLRIGESFASAFDARLVNATTSRWEFWFGLLQRFVDREQHADVPQTHEEDEFKLGVWVAGQRGRHRDGTLEHERVELLESLPGWAWHARTSRWDQGFEHLARFVKREGHARVPLGYVEDGFKLRVWVGTQRGAYKRKVISAERVTQLESLPSWTWDERSDMWEESFSRLRSYAEGEGHVNVATDNPELAAWIQSQRRRRRIGDLDDARAARLKSLPGWTWQPYDSAWDNWYERLAAFAAKNGHSRVPKEYREDGHNLGQLGQPPAASVLPRQARTCQGTRARDTSSLDVERPRGRMGRGVRPGPPIRRGARTHTRQARPPRRRLQPRALGRGAAERKPRQQALAGSKDSTRRASRLDLGAASRRLGARLRDALGVRPPRGTHPRPAGPHRERLSARRLGSHAANEIQARKA